MSLPSSSVVVRPRAPWLAAGAAVVAGVSIVVAFRTEPPRAAVFLAVLCAGWVGQQLLDRGRVLRAEFDDAGNVILASADDLLRLAAADVGGIGYSAPSSPAGCRCPSGTSSRSELVASSLWIAAKI